MKTEKDNVELLKLEEELRAAIKIHGRKKVSKYFKIPDHIN